MLIMLKVLIRTLIISEASIDLIIIPNLKKIGHLERKTLRYTRTIQQGGYGGKACGLYSRGTTFDSLQGH
jgi:hypothetical protein